MILVGVLILVILIILASCVKVVPQATALVMERLGAYNGTWPVGIHFKVPIIDRVAKKVTLKEQVVDFAPQPPHGDECAHWCIRGNRICRQ